jgi:hypothetical protein
MVVSLRFLQIVAREGEYRPFVKLIAIFASEKFVIMPIAILNHL